MTTVVHGVVGQLLMFASVAAYFVPLVLAYRTRPIAPGRLARWSWVTVVAAMVSVGGRILVPVLRPLVWLVLPLMVASVTCSVLALRRTRLLTHRRSDAATELWAGPVPGLPGGAMDPDKSTPPAVARRTTR